MRVTQDNRCELQWCDERGSHFVALRTGLPLHLCGAHAEKVKPPRCDHTFYLPAPNMPILCCSLASGHSGDHQHPHTNLRWGIA